MTGWWTLTIYADISMNDNVPVALAQAAGTFTAPLRRWRTTRRCVPRHLPCHPAGCCPPRTLQQF